MRQTKHNVENENYTIKKQYFLTNLSKHYMILIDSYCQMQVLSIWYMNIAYMESVALYRAFKHWYMGSS